MQADEGSEGTRTADGGRRNYDPWAGPKTLMKYILMAGGVAGVVAATLGVFGIKLIGPEDEIVSMQEDLKAASMRNYNAIDDLEDRVKRVEDVQELQTYLLCVQIRRTDPSMLPPGCTTAMTGPPPNPGPQAQ